MFIIELEMTKLICNRHLEILLVEDDPGDIELTRRVLLQSEQMLKLGVVQDGDEALTYLRQQGEYAQAHRPDLILLDLNLPGLTGQEVLAAIKSDRHLHLIPVLVLTTSDAQEDILKAYQLGANCYINKPLNLKKFRATIELIKDFWFNVATLPPRI